MYSKKSGTAADTSGAVRKEIEPARLYKLKQIKVVGGSDEESIAAMNEEREKSYRELQWLIERETIIKQKM